ncbi:hypothetical protein BJ138DRAFT_22956 [Hygrophoropsis aurantiaca]|uniref:Uncharacterized protein n=1 Tax=Hygrophoropsis aurantiaca TaxID=72124 RepID=A0ACB8ACC6_9AGAM|nr:hypothetical protein BJ138DRAFT_22956 [Hygrophoropsis aurantiaca]
MIIYAIMPRNFIFLGVGFLTAKLYVNAYLALLNARYYISPSDENKSSPEHADQRGVQITLVPFSGRKHVMSVEAGLIAQIPSDAVKPLSCVGATYS